MPVTRCGHMCVIDPHSGSMRQPQGQGLELRGPPGFLSQPLPLLLCARARYPHQPISFSAEEEKGRMDYVVARHQWRRQPCISRGGCGDSCGAGQTGVRTRCRHRCTTHQLEGGPGFSHLGHSPEWSQTTHLPTGPMASAPPSAQSTPVARAACPSWNP